MDNFNSDNNGYNKNQVNDFVDYVIKKTEDNIYTITKLQEEVIRLQDELGKYKLREENYNYANKNNEKLNYELKEVARKEADLIINEAKNNANRIVNDALLKAEKADLQKMALENNIKTIKKKLRSNLLQQLDMVEDIEIL